jgi:hypothetical protein
LLLLMGGEGLVFGLEGRGIEMGVFVVWNVILV